MGKEISSKKPKNLILASILTTFVLFPLIVYATATVISSIPRVNYAIYAYFRLPASSDSPIILFSIPLAILIIGFIGKVYYSRGYRGFSKGVFISSSLFALCHLIIYLLKMDIFKFAAEIPPSYLFITFLLFPILNFLISKLIKNTDIKMGMNAGYFYMLILIPLHIFRALYGLG